MSGAKYEFGQMVWHESEHCSWGSGRFITYKDGWAVVLFNDGVFRVEQENLTLQETPPPPNTVPVRIAVAVDKWGAASSVCGFSDDADAARMACEALCSADQCRVSFITAHVPLPAAPAEVNATPEVSE